MKLLGRVFGGDKKDWDQKTLTVVHGILSGELQKPLTEREMEEQLEINLHMIEDDKLTRLMESLCLIPFHDEEGKVLGYNVDLNALAVRFMASKLIRTSFIDPIDAEIAQLESEIFIDRVEMGLDEETYEYGGTNYLDACRFLIQTALSDAKNGRKAKMLKVMPRAFEINVPEVQKKKEGLM